MISIVQSSVFAIPIPLHVSTPKQKSDLWLVMDSALPTEVSKSRTTISFNGNQDWYGKQGEMVKKVVSSMPVHFQVSYKKHMTTHDSNLTICSSEVFYVPRRLVNDFKDLVNLVGNLDIHQKVMIDQPLPQSMNTQSANCCGFKIPFNIRSIGSRPSNFGLSSSFFYCSFSANHIHITPPPSALSDDLPCHLE
ncbi:hypothetical protein LXL04_030891 [Taraxacum kok-saghyz]